MIAIEKLWEFKGKLNYSHNLIHCITNPIVMNDCANAILALGAKPIMAQHPLEVEEITAMSKVLALNLGNFDDQRTEAMMVSAKYASQHYIPIILDLVGVGCSDIRKQFAKQCIANYSPVIIKGNLSEIKAMSDKVSHAHGVDVGDLDKEEPEKSYQWMQHLAKEWDCVIQCTGAVDIVVDQQHYAFVQNGHEMLTRITGTGCMLHAITACFLSCMEPFESAVMASAYFGIVGEKAYEEGLFPGKLHMYLFDWLYKLEKKDFMKLLRITLDGRTII